MNYALYHIHAVMLMINRLIIDQMHWFETNRLEGTWQAEKPKGLMDRLLTFSPCFVNRTGINPVQVTVLPSGGKYLLGSHINIQSIHKPSNPFPWQSPSRLLCTSLNCKSNFVSWLLVIHFNLQSLVYFCLFLVKGVVNVLLLSLVQVA